MADGALSIKLRCASWQQLATIYKRDLSHGTMFLKAATPPPVGTPVRIDLSLPSASVISLSGVVHSHVQDPQRGSGIELKLEPMPAGSVWLIESALASEQRRMATPALGVPVLAAHQMTGMIPTITEAADIAEAEQDLIKALVSEAESLKKLNPFLVLGVGYEATDSEVRAAFGELTKRYHPDRFARYESAELRQVAAEIFILIRDAYRRLGDAVARAHVLQSLGKPAPAPRAVPDPKRVTQALPAVRRTQRVSVVPPLPSAAGTPATPTSVVVPPPLPPSTPPATRATSESRAIKRPSGPPATTPIDPRTPRRPGEIPTPAGGEPRIHRRAGPDLVTDPRSGPNRRAATSDPAPDPRTPRRAATSDPAPDPRTPRRAATADPTGEPRTVGAKRAATDPGSLHIPADRRSPSQPPTPATEPVDVSAVEDLIDLGKLDDAVAAYKLLAKKHPQDRNVRAGVELCEGLRALADRDRLEAAQRFEAALEIDPSNERAARELAEMRRQATNERKGLLSRLMGKKEP
jgi:DnaJ-domain-containing protein 1